MRKMALTLTALLLVALPVLGSTATAAAAGAQSIRRVECSDHLHTPWIALYEDVNFGGRCNAYEGTGIIELQVELPTPHPRSMSVQMGGYSVPAPISETVGPSDTAHR